MSGVAGLEQDPRIEIYWQMLGLIRLDRGRPGEAADAFREAADLDPSNADYRMNEALAAMQSGQDDRARRIFDTLARSGSSVPMVWVNLGSLRARNDDWRGALEAWERAADLGEDSPQLRSGIEEARRRSG